MLAVLLSLLAHAAPMTPDDVLDRFHQAAATADEVTYFELMTDDFVFIGTDATERWPRAAFEAWAAPYFQREEAWTYVPVERHLTLAPGGQVAWFDERLTHARYGELRSSGVLVQGDEGWRIAHYVLSFPVPNDVAPDVVKRIARHTRKVAGRPAPE